jgi:hypothetical protein
MDPTYEYYIEIPVFTVSILIGLVNFKRLDAGSRILCFLLIAELVNESIAYYMAKKYHNNLAEYNIYSLIEFAIICWYFNNVIDVFRHRKFGTYIGAVGILFGIANLIFIQHLHVLNSYFLFVEGVLTIGMCLFAFFRLLLKQEELKIFKYHHFWFISIILFYWCITYLSWGLYDILGTEYGQYIAIISLMIWSVNILTYAGIGAIFLLYPKLQQK